MNGEANATEVLEAVKNWNLEVGLNQKGYISVDKLAGILDRPEDNFNFQFNLYQAREERAEVIMKKKLLPLYISK